MGEGDIMNNIRAKDVVGKLALTAGAVSIFLYLKLFIFTGCQLSYSSVCEYPIDLQIYSWGLSILVTVAIILTPILVLIGLFAWFDWIRGKEVNHD